MSLDHLMLNTESMAYLQLPKRAEWCNELWKIWEFVQMFGDIKTIDGDNPNFMIILDSPDWDDFETSMIGDPCTAAMVDVVQDLAAGMNQAAYKLAMVCDKDIREQTQ